MIHGEELSDIPEDNITEDLEVEKSLKCPQFESKRKKTVETDSTVGYNLEYFKPLGVLKIIKERKWLKTVTQIEGFIPRIVQEFYCNIHEDMADPTSPFYRKIYLLGHVSDLSYKNIADYLGISMVNIDKFDKEYTIDKVASELLGD
ncbi:hypothetical protein PanWU01x14_112750 [Parasponia andersonii]|uniref:Uncharacterized protein n=1 Tax=Parasponia andersonii TaxID=3476 RepID=A0A2P5CYC7_PARAD|nr:hypothetical protein PanWU01x14_112750 [Parasponia andersonii]